MGLSPYLSFIILLNPFGKIGSLIGGAFYIFLVVKKNYSLDRKIAKQ
jgi:hypothetical protein